MEEVTLVRILMLCRLLPASALSAVSEASQHVSSWSPEAIEEGKWFSLYPLWWMLGWDPFFSREPHKWLSLSRLKVLYCGHWDSRLSLVRLACPFILKTKFYSPQASRWTQFNVSPTQFHPKPSTVSNLNLVQFRDRVQFLSQTQFNPRLSLVSKWSHSDTGPGLVLK